VTIIGAEGARRFREQQQQLKAAARERLPGLEREHRQVWDRIRANDARLRDISQRLDQIPRDLVEVEDPDGKQAIMQERRALLEEQDMIKLEQVGLHQRESRLNFDLIETKCAAH
jgi:hypothetical protein